MTHLTHVSDRAGQLLCDDSKTRGDAAKRKEALAAEGDSFLHWTFYDHESEKPGYNPPDVCIKCKAFVLDESNYD